MQDLFSLLFIAGWIYWTHKNIEMLIIHRYPSPNTFIMASILSKESLELYVGDKIYPIPQFSVMTTDDGEMNMAI